jgi:hypothetical protein
MPFNKWPRVKILTSKIITSLISTTDEFGTLMTSKLKKQLMPWVDILTGLIYGALEMKTNETQVLESLLNPCWGTLTTASFINFVAKYGGLKVFKLKKIIFQKKYLSIIFTAEQKWWCTELTNVKYGSINVVA